MPNTNKEDLVTTEFVRVLRPMRRGWTVNQHQSHPLRENDREPDVIVTEPKRAPLAIEVKIDTERGATLSGEKQLRDFYLGKTLQKTGATLQTGIALRFPYAFRDMEQADIERAVAKTDKIAYCVLSLQAQGEEPDRFPKKGWLTGSVADIASAIRIGAVPIAKIEEAVQVLKDGVNDAAVRAEQTISERPGVGKRMADILVQESSQQTTQMAMLIIGNAFVFQSLLARKPDLETVPSLSELSEEYGHLSVTEVLQAWEDIREINYTPIFGVADRLVRVLQGDDRLAGDVLGILRKTALTLEQIGLAQEHELAGIAFQEFIAERKIIKANYTRPESAVLLCALVLPSTAVSVGGGVKTSFLTQVGQHCRRLQISPVVRGRSSMACINVSMHYTNKQAAKAKISINKWWKTTCLVVILCRMQLTSPWQLLLARIRTFGLVIRGLRRCVTARRTVTAAMPSAHWIYSATRKRRWLSILNRRRW